MPALFIYLIKVNVALLIFCAGYYAVLRHLTFYNLNRIYLVTAIIFSTLYPKVNVSGFLNRHEQIAKPIQVVVVNWQEPVKTIAKTFAGHDQWFWLQAAFWIGVVIFTIRLSVQLISLYRLHKRSEPAQLQQYVIRVIKGDLNPFSFWRNIYINPDNHPPHELTAILEHEQIHVDEWHTLDILLGEVSAIFYWFNPGIWLMKRAIRENIEFITDQKILQKGVDSKAYQYSLLNVNFGAQSNTIVNHFNISTIKKRIMMMNAKRSSKMNITRYLFLIPAVMVLLLIFSVSKAELKKAVKDSKHIMSSFKAEVMKISLKTTDPLLAMRYKASHLSAVSLFKIQADTIKKGMVMTLTGKQSTDTLHAVTKFMSAYTFASVADTDIKKKLIIKGGKPGDVKPDIYINGKKVDDLNVINSQDIDGIEVRKAGAVNSSIYITTSGHHDPLKVLNLKKTGDSVIIVEGKPGAKRLISPMGMSVAGNTFSITTGTNVDAVKINGHYADAKDVKVSKTITNGDTVYTTIVTHATPRSLAHADTILNRVNGTVIVNGIQNKKPVNVTSIIAGNAGRLYGQALTIKPAPISFANKLIIIDGKEATEKQLKKVSADKIDSISNLNYDAARALYGDKAKNGVVVITTKK